jgi:hypothetical protein
VPEKPFNISRPNNEQIWACLQRCLAFEDPAARFERLGSLVSKQLRDESLRVRDIPDWPLAYQDYLFSVIYGFNGDSEKDAKEISAAVMLNVVLAIEDTERFAEIAFESWRISLPSKPEKSLGNAFPAQSEDAEITELARRLELSSAKTMWLHHASRAVPDWSVMLSAGPWSGDARVQLLNTQLKKMMELPPDLAGYLSARSMFAKALERQRQDLPGGFQPDLILLVEGETETILLPHFAQLLGHNFSSMGVMIVSCGGAKQVARRYFELRDVVTLPMVMFVDADAGEEIEVVAESLRDFDRLHIWKDGELEDTLDTPVLVQQLNAFLQTTGAPGSVSPNDFPAGQRRTAILNKLWRSRGLGNFDKIGFAEIMSTHIRDKNDVPQDVVRAISAIPIALKQWQGNRNPGAKAGAS